MASSASMAGRLIPDRRTPSAFLNRRRTLLRDALVGGQGRVCAPAATCVLKYACVIKCAVGFVGLRIRPGRRQLRSALAGGDAAIGRIHGRSVVRAFPGLRIGPEPIRAANVEDLLE